MEQPESMAVPRNHDIVTLVIRDHEALQEMVDSIPSPESAQWADRFWPAAYELVRHEVAEEHVLYPAVQDCGAVGIEVSGLALSQQAVVERLLADLEKTGPANEAFEPAFEALKRSIRQHAGFEEEKVLPLIAEHLSDESRFELGDRYAQAKKRAPTHPHPHLAGDNRLALSVVAIADRVRDAVRGERPRPNRSAGPNPPTSETTSAPGTER